MRPTKKMIKIIIVGLVSFAAGFCLTVFVIYLLSDNLGNGWLRWGGNSGWGYILSFFLSVVIPTFAGLFFARCSIRWYSHFISLPKETLAPATPFLQELSITPSARKWIIRVAVVAYLFTWIFGVPAVESFLTAREIKEYKRMRDTGAQRVWDAHPYIKFYASFPILPGIIVTHHEFQLAGLYGWGGWDIHLWYVGGVKRLMGVGLWIS
jgi:hypothetical protein